MCLLWSPCHPASCGLCHPAFCGLSCYPPFYGLCHPSHPLVVSVIVPPVVSLSSCLLCGLCHRDFCGLSCYPSFYGLCHPSHPLAVSVIVPPVVSLSPCLTVVSVIQPSVVYCHPVSCMSVIYVHPYCADVDLAVFLPPVVSLHHSASCLFTTPTAAWDWSPCPPACSLFSSLPTHFPLCLGGNERFSQQIRCHVGLPDSPPTLILSRFLA